jgi:hypothetical protein
METRDYNTKMRLQEKNFYIEKFRMKMAGSLPSVAAEWIDGINKGTREQLAKIFMTVRNDIDWTSPDPQREKGIMPVWYRKNIYDPKMGTRSY